MNTTEFIHKSSDRTLSAYRSKSINPTLLYSGIHNYDTFRMKMTLDGNFGHKQQRPLTTSKPSKRYSVPCEYTSSRPLIVGAVAGNCFSSIDSYSPGGDTRYSYFPTRYKYVKGKKRPVQVNILDFQSDQGLGKKL